MIKAVVGLGNPGAQYELTRHNIGFLALDALADAYDVRFEELRIRSQAEIVVDEQKILLVKPQTYMNHIGRICPVLQKMGISTQEMLVVHDDLELNFGTVKLKEGGSAAGHNGLRSMIEQCGANFPRIRVGIGRPVKQDVSKYVLGRFSPQEMDELPQVLDTAVGKIRHTWQTKA